MAGKNRRRRSISGSNSPTQFIIEMLEERRLLSTAHFAAISDYGWDNANELAVSTMVKSWNPEFIVTAGDNDQLSDGTKMDVTIGKYYHEYINDYAGTYGAGSATQRFFPTMGNHDWDASAAYLAYFTLPGKERYYDFVQGPIHFFVLDGDSREPDGNTSTSVQAQWLQSKLATSTESWNMVLFHQPAYSSSTKHGSSTAMQWPFASWGVDAAISGHNHVYERLFVDGVSYFVDGLGGAAAPDSFGTSIPSDQFRYNSDLGAMLIDADETNMTFQFFSKAGTLIDTYTMSHSLIAPVNPVAAAASNSSIALTWENGSTSEDGFAIERSTDNVNFAQVGTVGANVLKYTDTGLNAGTKYYYRVRAYRGASEVSNYSTVVSATTQAGTTVGVIATGSTWKYLDNGTDQGTAWRATGFDDSTWKSGAAQLGYGDGDEATVLGYGADSSNKYITDYFRKAFTIANKDAFQTLTLRLMRDDGAVVYLNGTEVARSNLPTGTIAYNTLATTAIGGTDESAFYTFSISPSLLVNGTNVLAVEMHQSGGTSTDVSFEAELTGTVILAAPTVSTAASATPGSVTGTSTALSVLGNDDGGEASLLYTWAATTLPSGALAPSFSVNGTNGSKNTTATFSKAGTYTFTVTITDSGGLSVTSSVDVTVLQTPTVLTVTPAGAKIGVGTYQRFTATPSGMDQFGNALSSPPVTWSVVSGGGSIGSSGIYTAGTSVSTVTVRAVCGGTTAQTTLQVVNPTAAAVYKFEEGSGTTVSDSTGNGFGGTITGATYTAGEFGGGLAFNGTSNSVSLGNPAGLDIVGQIAMSAWIKPTATDGIRDILGRSYNSSPSQETFLRINAGKYEVGAWNGTTYLASAAIPAGDLNTWVHLVGVYDGQSWKLYRNGTLLASSTATVGALHVDKNWRIGSSDVPNRYFAGSIDEVRIFSQALTAGAVTALYNIAPPTITTAANASPSPVTGTSGVLSVVASDDAGESSLIYTWAATAIPNGAVAPNFSSNGTNASKSTTATFSQAGVYSFTVTTVDGEGLIATSSVDVTVNQTLTSITVTPASATIKASTTQAFTAVGKDQFGKDLVTQPTITWSTTIGSIGTDGVLTAPSTAGAGTVRATSGAISGTATVTVTNAVPTVSTAASATPGSVTGTSTALSVLGNDDGGEASLLYTWAATTLPSGAVAPSFSANGTNSSKNTTATFSKAGAYVFTVTIKDSGGLLVTSSVNVTVSQTLTSIAVTPATVSLNTNATQQFAASGKDQFGAVLSTQPAFTWSIASGGGTMSTAGLYTAPATAGSASIRATSGGTFGSAAVTIVTAPTPIAPTTLSGSKAGKTTTAKLSWKDNSTNESGFHVWSSRDGVVWSLLKTVSAGSGTKTISYTTGSLATGVWYFKVTAYNAAGDSNGTNVVTVTI